MAPTRKNAIQAVRAFEPATYAKDVSGFMGMDIKDHQLSGVVANLAVAKKKQKIIVLKELKLRPSTDKHDYEFKMKNAKKFISKGDKVKFTIKFKGREMDYMKAAHDLVEKIIEDTKDISKVEQQAKLEGRQMTLIIQPN